MYDPNVIPLGSMNYTAYKPSDFESLRFDYFKFEVPNQPNWSQFVRYKCEKYIEVSKAQYGNFAVDGKAQPQDENDTENRRGSEPLVIATFSNDTDKTCESLSYTKIKYFWFTFLLQILVSDSPTKNYTGEIDWDWFDSLISGDKGISFWVSSIRKTMI